MGLFFYFILNLMSDKLIYVENFKLIYLILCIIATFACYLTISVFTKAFKFSDINLKYK